MARTSVRRRRYFVAGKTDNSPLIGGNYRTAVAMTLRDAKERLKDRGSADCDGIYELVPVGPEPTAKKTTKRNRYGEPWAFAGTKHPNDITITSWLDRASGYCVRRIGFLESTPWSLVRRAILCVNACRGLTNAELRRGVVPRKGG